MRTKRVLPKYLTTEELDAFFEAIDDNRDRAIFPIAYHLAFAPVKSDFCGFPIIVRTSADYTQFTCSGSSEVRNDGTWENAVGGADFIPCRFGC
jgi:hypothetical protein